MKDSEKEIKRKQQWWRLIGKNKKINQRVIKEKQICRQSEEKNRERDKERRRKKEGQWERECMIVFDREKGREIETLWERVREIYCIYCYMQIVIFRNQKYISTHFYDISYQKRKF